MKRRGRQYRVHIQTSFTIQHGDVLPYRTCVIPQPRHPGEMRLSGLEILSLLLLAIECYVNAPDERFYTVRTIVLYLIRQVCRLLTAFRYGYLRSTRFRYED